MKEDLEPSLTACCVDACMTVEACVSQMLCKLAVGWGHARAHKLNILKLCSGLVV